ncbi:MAG TPA: ribonuclease III [Actinomycetota bacterium]|nr:ribonuclease III [Actinomycetota bacterium]
MSALGVPENRGGIYELALTHRSFAFEAGPDEHHNERLEWLGDAVLEAVISEFIFREFPDLPEGDMAKLRASVVNEDALAEQARRIGLGEHIRLGKGEESSGGRDKPSLLADAYEAVIGAVYLERGIEVVRESLVRLFESRIRDSLAAGRFDVKNELQEVVVKSSGSLPEYRVAWSGPDHDRRFLATVFVDGDAKGSGSGRTKKEAEQQAAREALESFSKEATHDAGSA